MDKRINEWLAITDSPRASAVQQRRSRLGKAILDLLQQHAPGVAALAPGAPWDEVIQAAMKDAIAVQFTGETEHAEAWNLIRHVIAAGRHAGLWEHLPWPGKVYLVLADSRIRGNQVPALRAAEAWHRQFVDALPRLVHCEDAEVLAGAVLASGAHLSAIVQPELLAQLPGLHANLHRHADHVWTELRLGTAERPWRNIRRAFLDLVSLLLLDRLSSVPSTHRSTHSSVADDALAALCDRLGLPRVKFQKLCRDARLRWSIRLPSWLFEYVISPAVSPSLPTTAWQRLISGRPLSARHTPAPTRALAAQAAAKATAQLRVEAGLAEVAEVSTDGFAQSIAIKRLAACLRRRSGARKLTTPIVRDRLARWREEHGALGGWIPWLGAWVQHALLVRRHSAFGHGEAGPGAPGILRYVEGFALRWIEHFHDLPPSQVETQPDEVADRMAQLGLSLMEMSSASVARTGLMQFLDYVAAAGGPRIALDSDWQVVVSPREADANLLAPAEYLRLREYLTDPAASDSYCSLRLRVMLSLAFRLGPRWEELQTRQLRDLQLTGEPIPRGTLLIRANSHLHGKTRDFRRALPLENFLSPDEREELRKFVAAARSLHPHRPATDFLFADIDLPSRPPSEESTHDVIQAGMRRVSGDPSLVFHHLRHCAANWLFARIFLDDAGFGAAMDMWPGSGMVRGTGLSIEGACMTAISDRGIDDPSRLYVVSELLGHIDPSTALRHYVHIADLVLVAYAHRQLALPSAVEAALGGIKRSSLRRARHRDRQRAHEATS